ncbi:MAG: zinc carboxypeptidase [Saprospiraceae bacterium]|nr:zinc carboxypeptidase [Saprospiraceae bacterium]
MMLFTSVANFISAKTANKHYILTWLLLTVQILSAQQTPKSPDEFLPHKIGAAFTPHHLQVDYFEYLASQSPATMKLEKYGQTNESRPLQYAIFSSPENMARLEQIRHNNLRLAGMEEGKGDVSNPVVIVWISMSVHGNEPSGAETSMPLAWQLATQTDTSIRAWLRNTVVILDPSLNPDGYDRYTHWNRMASNLQVNANKDAREHHEPWPGGRYNHYYFDLNRDWAWATQTETRQRLVSYHRWLPHIHPDEHEQGINEPYYFAPAAEPMHDFITTWQRDFQTEIGANHARYFDQNGWLYFTKEVFDLFYPSYGDTYPMFNGSIGMTYEQAGGPAGGRAVFNDTGDTLTLKDRIAHHMTTSRSTLEMASKNAQRIVENFRDYYSKTSAQPQGVYKSFIVKSTNNPNKINELCHLLDRHNIKYGLVGKGMSGVKAFDYASGKDISASISPDDLVISAYQPKSVLIQVLFEPEARLQDSLTYDITAWSLPFAQGLEAYALKDKVEPKRPFQYYQAPKVQVPTPVYSWVIRRKGLEESRFIGELLRDGVKVRSARKPFAAAEQQYEAGTFVIHRADNRIIANDLDRMVMNAAQRNNVPLQAILSGFVSKGADFGAESFHLIEKPEVAIVYGDDVDVTAYVHLWYHFEQELGHAITPIEQNRLHRSNLHEYSTLIFPDGQYNLSESAINAVERWVQNGGKLILLEGAIQALSSKPDFVLKEKNIDATDSMPDMIFYSGRERDNVSANNPGAIVRARVDNTHPIGAGLPEHYYSIKVSTATYEMPEKATAVVWLEDNYKSWGFIGSRIKPHLKKTPIVATQSHGRGEVIYFVDSPVFRCFWWQGRQLLDNAIFD